MDDKPDKVTATVNIDKPLYVIGDQTVEEVIDGKLVVTHITAPPRISPATTD